MTVYINFHFHLAKNEVKTEKLRFFYLKHGKAQKKKKKYFRNDKKTFGRKIKIISNLKKYTVPVLGRAKNGKI